jgi:hypothetical protein
MSVAIICTWFRYSRPRSLWVLHGSGWFSHAGRSGLLATRAGWDAFIALFDSQLKFDGSEKGEKNFRWKHALIFRILHLSQAFRIRAARFGGDGFVCGGKPVSTSLSIGTRLYIFWLDSEPSISDRDREFEEERWELGREEGMASRMAPDSRGRIPLTHLSRSGEPLNYPLLSSYNMVMNLEEGWWGTFSKFNCCK